MQARIGELEASLATGTSALRQLSTQQAGHSAPKPPKPPQPEKFQGDRRSGAASNWLHQMTLYLTILGLLDTAHAVPHAVSFLMGAARTWWRAQEASGSPPTTWTPSTSGHHPSNIASSETTRASAATHLDTVPRSAPTSTPRVQHHPQHWSHPKTSWPTSLLQLKPQTKQHLSDYQTLYHIMDPPTLGNTVTNQEHHLGTEHLADQNPRTWTPNTDPH